MVKAKWMLAAIHEPMDAVGIPINGAAGITTTKLSEDTNGTENWCTLGGRKLTMQSPKGIYVHNGKKVAKR